MKTTSLLILFLLCFAVGFGKDVPEKSARKVALNFYFEKASLEMKIPIEEITVSSYIPLMFDGLQTLHVYNIGDKKGFVVVSADDAAEPVLCYAFKGAFLENDSKPEAFLDWLEYYQHQIVDIKTLKIEASPEVYSKWMRYAADDFSPSKDITDVSPLTSSIEWGQGCYYNNSCPSDASATSTCNHCPVGCVATAMSQIMKFWEHPSSGEGSNSYSSSYGTLSADFAATTYNWAAMPNYLTTYNTSVATLCYHAGVSVEMGYSASGSGAYSSVVDNAFENNFKYATSVTYRARYSYADATWKGYITTDLNAGRPVYYSGTDEAGSSGHAFVCDGFQGTDYFHFNWGWDGYYNSYNYIDDLVPGGTGTGGGTGDYSFNQEAVFGIVPENILDANFSADVTSVLEGGQVNFTDNSNSGGGTITSWAWSFPGGTPSSYSGHYPPAITYNAEGTYNVTLTITASTGSNTETKTGYISVMSESAGFTLDFEGCTDFSADFSPWSNVDVDGLATYGSSDCDFTGENGPMSFIAFNPTVAGFSLSGAHGGSRCGLSVCPADASASNDYIISPKLHMGTSSSISLWVRSPKPSSWGNDTYKVEVSTTNTTPSSFTVISGSSAVEAPSAWTKHTYSLAAYNGMDIHVAIHHVSADKFMLLVDDIVISTNTTGVEGSTANRFKVYPNPSSGIFYTSPENCDIVVYDVVGKVVLTKKISMTDQLIDLSGQHPGLYFMKAKINGKTETFKLILEN
ncbi:MAG: hypothetical protein A2W91_08880 [Bacteroidetes bacterium GWF2_38_335]|nr:MAG: hypothetical protein A2W91_08880 [Bacteroidetes bacterium GWF2_38_335]OFY80486.1 MAG: hypothetical protein A2281_08605 [Bacteroidetes bacterium RIFOXYA12_FULL_38_20]HBS85905.1 hypothetical protein [Bacteroidales bacterium]